MSKVSSVLSSVAIASLVSDITGSQADAARAAGYSAFVESVTGSVPKIHNIGSKRVSIVLNSTQRQSLGKWLDKQLVSSLVHSDKKSIVQYNLGAVLTPWSMKYLIPSAIVIFAIGYYVGSRT